ncbi:hypothetical protein Dimus_035970 [Dionaea muscipula]
MVVIEEGGGEVRLVVKLDLLSIYNIFGGQASKEEAASDSPSPLSLLGGRIDGECRNGDSALMEKKSLDFDVDKILMSSQIFTSGQITNEKKILMSKKESPVAESMLIRKVSGIVMVS